MTTPQSRHVLSALPIVGLGLDLRLFRLDAQSVSYDEAYGAEVAEKSPLRIFAAGFGDNHPPFYSLALHYRGDLGRTGFSLRLFSTMAGVRGAAGVFALGRLVFTPTVRLLGAALAIHGVSYWCCDPALGKPPFRAVVEFLKQNAREAGPVLHTSDGSFAILLRYAPECRHLLADGDASPQLASETHESPGGQVVCKEDIPANEFLLLIALDNSVQFQTGMANWIRDHYRLTGSYDFEGILARRYASS